MDDENTGFQEEAVAELSQPNEEQPKSQSSHWKALRDSAAQLKAEKEQYKMAYEAMLAAMQNGQPQQQPQQEESIDDILSELSAQDDYPDVKVVQKTLKKVYEKAKKDATKESINTYKVGNLEKDTASQYQDYWQVTSDENVDKFLKQNKTIFEAIRRADNPYEAAYHYIKNHKDYAMAPSSPGKQQALQALEENASKPRTGPEKAKASVAGGIGSFRLMTNEQKAALVREAEMYGRMR